MAEVRMNLLLMGKTRVGKSATANSILGLDCFTEYSRMVAGTKEVNCNTARFEDRSEDMFEDIAVYVVDPPGLMDTETIEEERAERAGADMFEALIWCGGEVDAFLLVISYATKFTNDDVTTLEFLKIIFGEDYYKHLIVVVTRGDSFHGDMKHEGTPDKSFDTWSKEQEGPFRQLFADCNGRFVLFNNREEDAVKMLAQRQELIKLVKDLQRKEGKYTSETFEDAKEVRESFIFEQKAPLLQKNFLAIIGLLATDIQIHMNTPQAGGLEHIKEGIAALQNELEMADKSTGDYQPWMKSAAKLQENLHNTAELYRLAQELHAAQISQMERVGHLSRAAYATFVLAASVVGAPVAVVCGVGTGLYAIVSKIQSNLRFKRICTKIVQVTAKVRQYKKKKIPQIEDQELTNV